MATNHVSITMGHLAITSLPRFSHFFFQLYIHFSESLWPGAIFLCLLLKIQSRFFHINMWHTKKTLRLKIICLNEVNKFSVENFLTTYKVYALNLIIENQKFYFLSKICEIQIDYQNKKSFASPLTGRRLWSIIKDTLGVLHSRHFECWLQLDYFTNSIEKKTWNILWTFENKMQTVRLKILILKCQKKFLLKRILNKKMRSKFGSSVYHPRCRLRVKNSPRFFFFF